MDGAEWCCGRQQSSDVYKGVHERERSRSQCRYTPSLPQGRRADQKTPLCAAPTYINNDMGSLRTTNHTKNPTNAPQGRAIRAR